MPTMVRGEGSYLIDDTDERYLDLSAGLVAVNLGHSHPRVVLRRAFGDLPVERVSATLADADTLVA